eukprot:69455_1
MNDNVYKKQDLQRILSASMSNGKMQQIMTVDQDYDLEVEMGVTSVQLQTPQTESIEPSPQTDDDDDIYIEPEDNDIDNNVIRRQITSGTSTAGARTYGVDELLSQNTENMDYDVYDNEDEHEGSADELYSNDNEEE